jgi:two-component system response regulator AtoC
VARILVVEDQPLILQLASRILELSGHTVTPSATRAAAVEALDSPESFDLVLTDMNLPDGTAGDLLPHLAETRPVPAVIVMSGYETEGFELQATAGRPISLLQKPFAPADLSAAVDAALAPIN